MRLGAEHTAAAAGFFLSSSRKAAWFIGLAGLRQYEEGLWQRWDRGVRESQGSAGAGKL